MYNLYIVGSERIYGFTNQFFKMLILLKINGYNLDAYEYNKQFWLHPGKT